MLVYSNVLRFFPALLLCIGYTQALHCQTDDGHTDAELKRVVRKCMRKISENGYQSESNNNPGNYRQHQHISSYGQGDGEADYDYDERNWNNYDRQNHQQRTLGYGDGAMWQRNQNHGHTNHSEAQHFGSNHNARSIHNNSGMQQKSSAQRNEHGLYNNNNNNNQKHQYNGNNSNNNNSNINNESSCISHCFFDELNMLNAEGYPDRQKVTIVLSKDLRERELRNFYIDTIQECFRYMESQRRRDKCSYSRELVNCMLEYFKANCNDWDRYNILFT